MSHKARSAVTFSFSFRQPVAKILSADRVTINQYIKLKIPAVGGPSAKVCRASKGGLLGSSFRGRLASWAVVWQTRPFAIAADKEARGLPRPRYKTAFTGYLIVRLGADITVNQHFAFFGTTVGKTPR
jgi:hypothetical protein